MAKKKTQAVEEPGHIALPDQLPPAPTDYIMAHEAALDALRLFSWALSGVPTQKICPDLRAQLNDLTPARAAARTWLERLKAKIEANLPPKDETDGTEED